MVRKSDLYKVDGDKIERKNPICPRCGEGVFMADHGDRFRKNPICPRCGEGVFMADHGDRFACGKCGYTEMKK